jgi:serine/threonine protein kinase
MITSNRQNIQQQKQEQHQTNQISNTIPDIIQKDYRKRKPLALTLCDEHAVQKQSPCWKLSNSIYRSDGVSIGHDFLRLDGLTISRGEFSSLDISIREVVGKGAFSSVYRGLWTHRIDRMHENSDGRNSNNPVEVAIKKFAITESDNEQSKMLRRELRTMCQLKSPFLVQMYGSFFLDNEVTLVLEYMKGGSLACLFQHQKSLRKDDCISNEPFLSERIISSISYQVLSGLEYLHSSERRFLHRDLKPANVLFDWHSGFVKLCDFGISSLLNENSLSTTVVGTRRYMSPERLRAKPYGRASDIWSVGLIIVECVTGILPWDDIRSIFDLVVTVEETNPDDLIAHDVSIHCRLREIILGCLQIDPSK